MCHMLYENDVVAATCDYLTKQGWLIVSQCTARQRGDDIVATRDGQRLVVECKGETSSDPRSKRYGKTFTRGQVYDHVAVGVLRALREVGRDLGWAAIAVPDNADHRRFVGEVAGALVTVGVGVFWVGSGGHVTPEVPWAAASSAASRSRPATKP
jgi:hypothetical protein